MKITPNHINASHYLVSISKKTKTRLVLQKVFSERGLLSKYRVLFLLLDFLVKAGWSIIALIILVTFTLDTESRYIVIFGGIYGILILIQIFLIYFIKNHIAFLYSVLAFKVEDNGKLYSFIRASSSGIYSIHKGFTLIITPISRDEDNA